MIVARESNSRIGWLATLLVLLAFVTLGLPGRMLTQITYAVERGKLQASTEELATLDRDLVGVQEVSHAFRLVANIAKPGVVHIRVSADQAALDRMVELNREYSELSDRLEQAREQVKEGSEDQLSAEDFLEIHDRQGTIRDEIERLRDRLSPGSGSGIIFDEDGHILTNNHVVEDRREIRVQLPDEREYQAVLVGNDPQSDLAVIKVDAPDLHPLRFGDSDQMQVGDWVVAVGAPFGLSQSVTHGIISATGRTDVVPGRGIRYQNFLQTDAAINPGNSGGPLLNLRGEVVGVNTAIATSGDTYNAGVAFTIPANMAVKVANALKQSGQVARGWLGITLSELTDADTEIFDLPDTAGVMVDALMTDSPARAAGLLCEDILLDVNGVKVKEIPAVQAVIADILPGDIARLTILRNGHREQLDVRLGRLPDDLDQASRRANYIIARDFEPLAIRVRSLREALPITIAGRRNRNLALQAAQFGDSRGVFVVESKLTSDADPPEIEPGEMIVSCDGKAVKTVADLADAFSAAPKHRTLDFEVLTPDGQRRTLQWKRPR